MRVAVLFALVAGASALVGQPNSLRWSVRSARGTSLRLRMAAGEEQSLRTAKVVVPADGSEETTTRIKKRRRKYREEDEQNKDGTAGRTRIHSSSDKSSAAVSTTKKGFMPEDYPGKAAVDSMKGNVMATVVLPAVAGFVLLRSGFLKLSSKAEKRTDRLIHNYAFEMIKYEGNLNQMQDIHKEYAGKLGKGAKDEMAMEFFRQFFAKRLVNRNGLKTMAFVISMNGMSDKDAAEIMMEYAEELRQDQVTLKGKLYYAANKVLKSKDAMALLAPLRKDIIKNLCLGYEDLFEESQADFGRIAVRSLADELFAAARKGDDNAELGDDEIKAIGDEVFEEANYLGLSREEVISILGAAMDGDEESFYGTDGAEDADAGAYENLMENAKQMQEEQQGGGGGAVGGAGGGGGGGLIAECGNCGHTMFIAQGREEKFFGESFTCPSCNAPKDQFKTRTP